MLTLKLVPIQLGEHLLRLVSHPKAGLRRSNLNPLLSRRPCTLRITLNSTLTSLTFLKKQGKGEGTSFISNGAVYGWWDSSVCVKVCYIFISFIIVFDQPWTYSAVVTMRTGGTPTSWEESSEDHNSGDNEAAIGSEDHTVSTDDVSERWVDITTMRTLFWTTSDSWPLPDECEVMTHKDVQATIDKNLAKSYDGLPNLVYVYSYYVQLLADTQMFFCSDLLCSLDMILTTTTMRASRSLAIGGRLCPLPST